MQDYQTYQDSARIEAAFRKHIHRATPLKSTQPQLPEVETEVIVCHGMLRHRYLSYLDCVLTTCFRYYLQQM